MNQNSMSHKEEHTPTISKVLLFAFIQKGV